MRTVQNFLSSLNALQYFYFRSQNASDDTSIQNTVDGLSTTIPVKVVSMGERRFSRGRALAKGSASTQDSNSLLFFTDVDMLFDYETLERIRLNTILGAQVRFTYKIFKSNLLFYKISGVFPNHVQWVLQWILESARRWWVSANIWR